MPSGALPPFSGYASSFSSAYASIRKFDSARFNLDPVHFRSYTYLQLRVPEVWNGVVSVGKVVHFHIDGGLAVGVEYAGNVLSGGFCAISRIEFTGQVEPASGLHGALLALEGGRCIVLELHSKMHHLVVGCWEHQDLHIL